VDVQEEWEFLQLELEHQGWDETDIEKVWEAIRSTAASMDLSTTSTSGTTTATNMEWTMVGCLEFLQTLLQFPDVATPTVVLASILHYFECVLARQEGIYDTVRQRLMMLPPSRRNPPRSVLALPSYPNVIDTDLVQDTTSKTQIVVATTPIDRRKQKRVERRKHRRKLKQTLIVGENELQDAAALSSTSHEDSTASPFSDEVLELARAASQIKRAEIVSEIILIRKRKADHDKLQNLLVSVSGEDWRALAIRCIASLYRLQASDPLHRYPELTATARSAMQVYAPLAQRMGLPVLKTRLENKAFHHLYPRQYKAAVAIFEHRGDSMKAVEQYLQQQIWHLLQQDTNLDQVDWKVTTRVKEPYSLWKKLLRKSMPGTMHWMLHPGEETTMPKPNTSNQSPRPKKEENDEANDDAMQSMLRIRDGVALRIIVQSSYTVPGESESDRQNRDHVACYYVHHLIRSVFPESHPGHVKDYIANPKRNGYQSLHHTSSLRMNGLEIPFEIQVRSHDMHRVAEFGVAAHWDYTRGDATAVAAVPTTTTTAGVALVTRSTRRLTPDMGDSLGPTGSSLTRTTPSMTTSSSTPYLQALEVARKSLVQSSAFVFVAGTSMEHGQLVSVSKGERVVDIWNQVFSLTEQQQQQQRQGAPKQQRRSNHSNEKEGRMTVWRNGRLAELNETVQNGDVLLFQHEKVDAEEESEMSGQRQQQRQSHLSLRKKLLKATSS